MIQITNNEVCVHPNEYIMFTVIVLNLFNYKLLQHYKSIAFIDDVTDGINVM